MVIQLSARFQKDLIKLKAEDKTLGFKLWELVGDIVDKPDNPLYGKGKPEKLKGQLSGYYSRRITQKHRLIYCYKGESILLVSCYGHYEER